MGKLATVIGLNCIVSFKIVQAMPKIKPSYPSKVKAVVNEHTSEFKSAPSGELYCKLCDCIVRCEKKFMVESHRHSVKH